MSIEGGETQNDHITKITRLQEGEGMLADGFESEE